MKQLTTQFTKYLNVHYPIIQAGMAGSTTPELVAAVRSSRWAWHDWCRLL